MAVWTDWTPGRPGQRIHVFIAYALLLQVFVGLKPSHIWQVFKLSQDASHQLSNATTPSQLANYFQPMADLVHPYGYKLEEHFVTTSDGFILRLFRIPCHRSSCSRDGDLDHPVGSSCADTGDWDSSHKQNSSHSSPTRHIGFSRRPVIFLQHALMDSSAGWLLLGPSRSLALLLADAGFDVWLGNSRGNRYSRNHTVLQPEDTEFWAWSWDHMAELDLPASISYALAVSRQEQLVYVGYSQGTMIGLAALASQPQLAASVSLAMLLAPVAFTTAMTSPAFVLSSLLHMDAVALARGWAEWGSFQQANSETMTLMCRQWPLLCLKYLTVFCGHNPNGNVSPELVPLVFKHLPAGTSVQVMAHWAQGIRRKSVTHLHRFDYGAGCSSASAGATAGSNGSSEAGQMRPSCNRDAYAQPTPPVYDLADIKTPLALFTGGRDTISSVEDVALLKQRLQPGILQLHHHQPDYAHLDFELGSDAPELVYPDMLRLAVKFGLVQHQQQRSPLPPAHHLSTADNTLLPLR